MNLIRRSEPVWIAINTNLTIDQAAITEILESENLEVVKLDCDNF